MFLVWGGGFRGLGFKAKVSRSNLGLGDHTPHFEPRSTNPRPNIRTAKFCWYSAGKEGMTERPDGLKIEAAVQPAMDEYSHLDS